MKIRREGMSLKVNNNIRIYTDMSIAIVEKCNVIDWLIIKGLYPM